MGICDDTHETICKQKCKKKKNWNEIVQQQPAVLVYCVFVCVNEKYVFLCGVKEKISTRRATNQIHHTTEHKIFIIMITKRQILAMLCTLTMEMD